MSDFPPLVILGCGYVGGFVARAALARGQRVRACARHLDKLLPLSDLGAEVRAMDASKNKQFGPALIGLAGPAIIYSIPPPPGMPAGEAVRRAGSAALTAGAHSFVYLGTVGVHGNRPSEDWIDEDNSMDLSDDAMAARRADEMALQSLAAGGLRTVSLRLSAIYGPGRGVREKMRRGDYRMGGDGHYWFSRIHVLDLVSVILAASDRAAGGSVYCVGDDKPTQQQEYATWLAAHLGLQPPPVGPLPLAHRGRRIRNDKMKRELGLTLRFPTYAEGEAYNDEVERKAEQPVM